MLVLDKFSLPDTIMILYLLATNWKLKTKINLAIQNNLLSKDLEKIFTQRFSQE